jgi:hypothetical protein
LVQSRWLGQTKIISAQIEMRQLAEPLGSALGHLAFPRVRRSTSAFSVFAAAKAFQPFSIVWSVPENPQPTRVAAWREESGSVAATEQPRLSQQFLL